MQLGNAQIKAISSALQIFLHAFAHAIDFQGAAKKSQHHHLKTACLIYHFWLLSSTN